MTVQRINFGSAPNDGTGDPNRDAWGKTDANFVDLDSRVNAAIPLTQKGAAGGVAPLNESGVVPAVNLPSYVDDVIEVATHTALPNNGESGKIYVVLNDTGSGGTGLQNVQYRWTGSAYVELIASPGTTDNVPEGASNRYFTSSRAIAALSTDAAAARANLSVYSEAEVDSKIASGVSNSLPCYAANAIPAANKGSDIEVQGVGVMSWNATTNRYEMVHREYGCCFLGYTSASQVTLAPFGGNGVFFDGFQYRIPSSGVVGNAAGLTAGTNQNVYLVGNRSTGGLALEFSTTAHAVGPDGQRYKAGDNTRLLVGKVRVAGGVQFVDAPTARGVISWFNRKPITVYSSLSSSTFSNTTNAQISNVVTFLSWGDRPWVFNVSGYMSSVNAGQTQYVTPTMDGIAQSSPYANGVAASGISSTVGGATVIIPSEDYHTISLYGYVGTAGNTTIGVNFSCVGEM